MQHWTSPTSTKLLRSARFTDNPAPGDYTGRRHLTPACGRFAPPELTNRRPRRLAGAVHNGEAVNG